MKVLLFVLLFFAVGFCAPNSLANGSCLGDLISAQLSLQKAIFDLNQSVKVCALPPNMNNCLNQLHVVIGDLTDTIGFLVVAIKDCNVIACVEAIIPLIQTCLSITMDILSAISSGQKMDFFGMTNAILKAVSDGAGAVKNILDIITVCKPN